MSRRINGDLPFIFFPHLYKARERSKGMDGKNYQKDFNDNVERKVKEVMFDGIDDIHGECSDEDYINFINEQKAKQSETFKNKESNDIPKKTVKTKDVEKNAIDKFIEEHPTASAAIACGALSLFAGLWLSYVVAYGVYYGNIKTMCLVAKLAK